MLDELDRATLLNQHIIATVKHAAISITVGKKLYEYEFPAYGKYAPLMGKGMKVPVYYDETNLSSVTVFGFTDAKDTGTDMYLTTLKRASRMQMAKAEQTPGDLLLLSEKEAQRNGLRGEIDRKQLELQASRYRLAVPAGISTKELRALVKGAELTDTTVEAFDVRYAEVLNSPAAAAQVDFYADKLLRDNGLRVPVEATPAAKKPGLSYKDRMRAYEGQNLDFS